MTAATLHLDLAQCHTRTRRTMTASVVLHALLFLWIATIKSSAIETPPITEITMLSAGDLATIDAGPAEAAPRVAPRPGLAPRKVEVDQRFERSADRADITLDPQSPTSIADQLSARLSRMTQEERPAVPGTVIAPPSAVFGSGPVTAKGMGMGVPVALSRGGALGGAGALPLSRGGGGGAGTAPATLPAVKTVASAPAQVGDATARRTIAGASVAGPIADRAVLQTVVPEYPEWAKKEAVEGSVTLYFVVRSDGTVKENVVIQKTAGFGDFDENARTALRGWLFEPLRGGRTGEQWGTITFHFRLRDAG
ncbi:MAG TPA: energy transducer TonB [Candidatus Binatia bacterium]|nr:energy transducer TonB [Candidatus Binatia bacterium]